CSRAQPLRPPARLARGSVMTGPRTRTRRRGSRDADVARLPVGLPPAGDQVGPLDGSTLGRVDVLRVAEAESVQVRLDETDLPVWNSDACRAPLRINADQHAPGAVFDPAGVTIQVDCPGEADEVARVQVLAPPRSPLGLRRGDRQGREAQLAGRQTPPLGGPVEGVDLGVA